MSQANTAFFFSTNFIGNGVIDKKLFPQQVDPSMPSIHQFTNVLASASEVDENGLPFQGNASIQILNISTNADPAPGGSVVVRLNVLFDRPINVRLALVIWPV
jgi:hypothetical protein